MSIEELAFKDRKILANLNAVDLLNIIEFLQDDRRQCLEELSKTHNRSVEIQKENQEFKEALEAKSYCKYANKCTEFDDCSREEYETMAIENIKLSIENQGLKEKLNKYENPEDMTLFAMWCTEKVKDENEKLKKHLKVPKTCNLKTLEDYKSYYEDTTREQILEDTYIEYCAYVNLAHRYSELKKQLENCYCNRTDCAGRIKDSKKYDSLVQAQEVQQKEFINYLQKEINQHTAHIDAINSYGISIYSPDYDNSKLKLAIFKEVLLKYIETIQTKIDKSV